MKRDFLVHCSVIFGVFAVAMLGLFIVQLVFPLKGLPPIAGKNGGIQYTLDSPLPTVSDVANFGTPDMAYGYLVNGVNVIKASTGGQNVIITNITTDRYSDNINGADLPVYIFRGQFNDTAGQKPYTAYVVSPVYVFQGYNYDNNARGSVAYIKSEMYP